MRKKTNRNALRFLEVISQIPNVSAGARAIGCTPSCVQMWKKDKHFFVVFPDRFDDDGEMLQMTFSDAWDEAMNIAVDGLEELAWGRATYGHDRVVTFKGQPSYIIDEETGEKRLFTVRDIDNRLLETMLKAHRPEKYRERHEIALEQTGGVMVIPQGQTLEDWSQQARIQQEKAQAIAEAQLGELLEGEATEIKNDDS